MALYALPQNTKLLQTARKFLVGLGQAYESAHEGETALAELRLFGAGGQYRQHIVLLGHFRGLFAGKQVVIGRYEGGELELHGERQEG